MHKKFFASLFSSVLSCFLLILLFNFPTKAQQNPVKFSHLTVDNGLSHTDVRTVLQDKKGFIWIATLFGLNRFDGYTVKRFYNSNVPKDNAFKNRIMSMCLDEQGRIWIGSEAGIQLFDPKTEKYTDVDNVQQNTRNQFYWRLYSLKGNKIAGLVNNRLRLFSTKGLTLTDIPVKQPAGVQFTDMTPDHNGNIWLSSNKDIWVLEPSLQFRKFEVTDSSGKPASTITRIYVNRLGQLLTTSGAKIMLLKMQTQTLLLPKNSSISKINAAQQATIQGYSFLLEIVQDKNLNYWISTDKGLLVLDSVLNIKQAIKEENAITNLNTNNVEHLFIDRSECLWVSTWETGINILDLNAKPFYTLQHTSGPNSLSGNYIRSMIEEPGKNIWIGTNGSGLNEYNPQKQRFKHYTTATSPVKLKNDHVHALTFDNALNLWIGTDKGIQILNKNRDALLQPAGYEKLPTHSISGLATDYYGNIWFGSFHSGFGSITTDKKENYKVTYHGKDSGHLIWADSKRPQLFVSSTNGLFRMVIDSSGNVLQTFHYSAGSHPNSLSSNYVFQVQQQNDSTYWIGTIGGGLNRLELKKGNNFSIKTYGGRYGIFNDVASLEMDNKNNIWMGGNGLENFNPGTGLLTRYNKNDGLQGTSFKIGASWRSSDGRLYFGGVNGLNYFFPDSIKVNHIEARPIFTDLLINNKKVVIGRQDSLSGEIRIDKSISYTNRLQLSYLQNDFAVSFSAMHYANPQKCQYRYKLIGFDQEWKFTDGNNPTASYNNLDYKDYTLLVQATNNDGIWSSQQASLSITVTPPWWKSTLAKFIYAVLFLSGLIGIYVYQARWFRLKREISIHELEEKRKEDLYQQQVQLNHQIQEKNNVLQESDKFKNKLVSMLAHDFRSPLASTISIARLMRDNQGFTETEMEEFYGDIENDANKMLESFDTILQWIKQQLSGYRLEPETLLIRDLLNESAALFQQQISAKNITFLNQVPADAAVITDKEMLQFIHRNLLSNAIKFSPEGGTIAACSTVSNGELTLGISDEGMGMSDKVLKNLFSVSTQVGSSNREGAGIALSMCKDFIQKLNGKIWAMNRKPNGVILHYTIPAQEKTT